MGKKNINLTRIYVQGFCTGKKSIQLRICEKKKKCNKKVCFSGFGLILFLKVPNHNNSYQVVKQNRQRNHFLSWYLYKFFQFPWEFHHDLVLLNWMERRSSGSFFDWNQSLFPQDPSHHWILPPISWLLPSFSS